MGLDTMDGVRSYWKTRLEQQGESYVGRREQDFRLQQQRVESLIKTRFKADDFFPHAMDFGCGMGRFIPTLESYCGHIWAVDLLDAQLSEARKKASHVTSIKLGDSFDLPWAADNLDLLWACLVFQHIINDDMLDTVCAELTRVMHRGCRVVILDNAVDRAPHVKSRHPETLARRLKLQTGYTVERVTIDERPSDHWLIDGIHY